MKKRVLSLLLVLLMVIRLVPISALADKADESSMMLTGNGTADSPYLIRTEDDLILLAENVQLGESYVDTYFKVIENIALTKDITPIGTETTPFRGVFDGSGLTISGITGSGFNVGLFAYVGGGACIKNVIVNNVNISGESHLGGIAANVNHSLDPVTFSNCHTLSGTIKGRNGADYLGGLIGCGYTDSGKGIIINNCTNYVQINAGNDSNFSGGIVGKINNSKVSNCINYGAIVGNGYSEENGSTHMGGICASSVNTEFQGCANYGAVHTFFACGISGGYKNRFIGCINAGKLYHSSDGWGYAIGDKNNNSYEDCYYLNSSVMYYDLGGEPIYNYRYGISWQDQNLTASSFAEDDLYSGKIAYLLGEYYGQRIGIDKYPVIINDNNRVHKVEFVGDIESVYYVTHGTPVCIVDADSSNVYYREGEVFDISEPIYEDIDLKVVKEIHELIKIEAVTATCTEPGNNEYYICVNCNKCFKDEKKEDETTAVAETTAPLGHKTEIRGAVAPTCTEAGYTGDEVCTVCGEIVSQGEAIEPTGHHYKGNTCIDCGAHRSTGDTIRAWLQDAAQQLKNFFDKIFGKN